MAVSSYEQRKIDKKLNQVKKKIEHMEIRCQRWEEILNGTRKFDYLSKKYIAIFCFPIILIVAAIFLYLKYKSFMVSGIFLGAGLVLNIIVFVLVQIIDKARLGKKIEKIKPDIEKLKESCAKLEMGYEDYIEEKSMGKIIVGSYGESKVDIDDKV